MFASSPLKLRHWTPPSSTHPSPDMCLVDLLSPPRAWHCFPLSSTAILPLEQFERKAALPELWFGLAASYELWMGDS